jgi:hypothetical protein
MTLEEMIRQIVRDEVAKTQRPPTAPERWRDMFTQPQKCPLGCPPLSACGNVACPMRAPTVTYKADIVTGHMPEVYKRPQPPSFLTDMQSDHATGMAVDDAVATGTGILSVGLDLADQRTVVVKNISPELRYTPPVDNTLPGGRLGCACAPGVERICDDATCPWKNKP